MNFGREVKRRRTALGLTLEKLAERSGLTPHYLSTLENGKRDPRLSTVRAVAKGLGVAPGLLLGPVKDVSPTAAEAGRLFERAPRDIQEGVLRILTADCLRGR